MSRLGNVWWDWHLHWCAKCSVDVADLRAEVESWNGWWLLLEIVRRRITLRKFRCRWICQEHELRCVITCVGTLLRFCSRLLGIILLLLCKICWHSHLRVQQRAQFVFRIRVLEELMSGVTDTWTFNWSILILHSSHNWQCFAISTAYFIVINVFPLHLFALFR